MWQAVDGQERQQCYIYSEFPQTHVDMRNYIIKSLKYHRLTSQQKEWPDGIREFQKVKWTGSILLNGSSKFISSISLFLPEPS